MPTRKRYIVRNGYNKVIAREDTAADVNNAIRMNVIKQMNKMGGFFDPKIQVEEGWRHWIAYLDENLDLQFTIEDTTIPETN